MKNFLLLEQVEEDHFLKVIRLVHYYTSLRNSKNPEEQQEHQEETTEDAISNKSEDSIDAAPFDPRMRRRRNKD